MDPTARRRTQPAKLSLKLKRKQISTSSVDCDVREIRREFSVPSPVQPLPVPSPVKPLSVPSPVEPSPLSKPKKSVRFDDNVTVIVIQRDDIGRKTRLWRLQPGVKYYNVRMVTTRDPPIMVVRRGKALFHMEWKTSYPQPLSDRCYLYRSIKRNAVHKRGEVRWYPY